MARFTCQHEIIVQICQEYERPNPKINQVRILMQQVFMNLICPVFVVCNISNTVTFQC